MKRKLTIAGIVIGAILALGPLWSLQVTVSGMKSVFAEFGRDAGADPHALSPKIHAVLSFQTYALIGCPIGIALLIFCIFKLQAIHRTPPPVPPMAAGDSGSEV